jgi:hypothetical protein
MPDFHRAAPTPERGRMTMKIFLLLNAIGVVFLLFTLVNFWNEWRRLKSAARECEIDPIRENDLDALETTDSPSQGAEERRCVIPFERPQYGVHGQKGHTGRHGTIHELAVKRYSRK